MYLDICSPTIGRPTISPAVRDQVPVYTIKIEEHTNEDTSRLNPWPKVKPAAAPGRASWLYFAGIHPKNNSLLNAEGAKHRPHEVHRFPRGSGTCALIKAGPASTSVG
jgi:hypothetical protein